MSSTTAATVCGILGYFSKEQDHKLDQHLRTAIHTLSQRGPDLQESCILSSQVGFGHSRLSILDTSALGNQPMTDKSGRYTIIFNGEIFNFRELKNKFLKEQELISTSDTEVLLYLYINLGRDCLNHLNGFFAFAIFDNLEKEIFLARDRFGIKPLHIYTDERMILFTSELKAIMTFPIKKEINHHALSLYLQLNYVPGDDSILTNCEKLLGGYYAVIDSKGSIMKRKYYDIPFIPGTRISESGKGYSSSVSKLKDLIDSAVQKRLISDVPLGAFLSGGIDSSIITSCAAIHVKHLNTFSIGYKDNAFYDETYYANLVAKKYNTNHTVFSLTNEEMYASIFSMLDYIDEPFADSSAIAVYLLCKNTAQKVTVALSGDGGDELFGGYNKHKAELFARQNSFFNALLKNISPLLGLFPQSRSSSFANLARQIKRYNQGLSFSRRERYWNWCIIHPEGQAFSLLKNPNKLNSVQPQNALTEYLNYITETGDLNDNLLTDAKLILQNDMLTKVDMMSMANSIEVRVPLLDYRVVDFAFSLPISYKLNKITGKRILKDAYKAQLPNEIFERTKKGFEVPLLEWMRKGLNSLLKNELLERTFLEDQKIFNYEAIESLKLKLFSHSPEDTPAILWNLLVFQYWYKKYFA